jgi:mono/diheme cytochrome c family protein
MNAMRFGSSIWIMFLLIVCSAACNTQRKVVYNLPDGLDEKQKELLLADLNKGKVLYRTHCMSCHGIFTKRQDGIPDFTYAQLDEYTARYVGHDPQNHAFAENMSQEQLGLIISFLKHRKRDTPAK